jgi:hypothetical protein
MMHWVSHSLSNSSRDEDRNAGVEKSANAFAELLLLNFFLNKIK